MRHITKFKSLFTLPALVASMLASSASADIYKVFWPEEMMQDTSGWDTVKIVNISSNTVLDGSMSGVYTQDLAPLISGAAAANSGGTYQMVRSLDALVGGGQQCWISLEQI